jgi:DNA polymerase (family 10)
MDRRLVADILDECGTLLELKGENPFRCNAYHNAARSIQQLEGDLAALVAADELRYVRGIGESMAEKIKEIVETGSLAFHKKLRSEIPAGLLDMLHISGFGPKRIRAVHDQLGITTIAQLKSACSDGRLANLKGFGEKTAANILKGIEFLDRTGKRVLFPIALELANRLRASIEGHPAVKRLAVCGSLRRGKETIKDIDLLVASDDPDPIMKQFVSHPDVIEVIGRGTTKSSVILHEGVPADLRVVTDAQFPFALHYFTGSKDHNVAMRGRAQQYGLKLNEYELAGAKRNIDCRDEADIFAALDLDYIPPELREDTGEIEAAAAHALPTLIEYQDLTGTFHCHTTASDGRATLEEMVAAAKAVGLKYLGIADHSQTAAYAGGLTPDRVRQQHKKIDELNAREKRFYVYKGIESDILPDGSLDYNDKILASFDYVVASIHSSMNLSEEQMTKRVIRAIRHPRCTMLGHPTGRLLLQRDAFAIDLEQVLTAAAETGVMIEINANPHRLDLDWVFCKRAKALGVMLVINPDAHDTDGLADLQYGVATARRGWLEAHNVFNTRPPNQVAKALAKRRSL